MSANKYLVVLAMAATLSQGAMAQEASKDSAYQWGRWAVLSPAAGGQAYQAPSEPGADNNYRPGDFYDPQVQALVAPPVGPPTIVPNPPGNPPLVGDPRGERPILPPFVVPNPLGAIGDPRGERPILPPVVVPSPGATPSVGDPRGA